MLVRFKPKYLMLFLGLSFGLWSSNLTAQENRPSLQWRLEAGSSLSFTGINLHLAATSQWRAHEFFVGPKWVLSDTYLLQRGPWGIDLGYRWHLIEKEQLSAFTSLEYQVAFLGSESIDRKISVQEMHWTNGFRWRLKQKWALGQCLGLGGVLERSKVLSTGNRYELSGFSILLKIFVSYQL